MRLGIRFSVTQLRVGMLVVNLLLAGGVLGYAAYSYYHQGANDAGDDFRLADPSRFVPTDGESIVRKSRAQTLQTSAEDINQPPPPVAPPPPPPDKTADSTPAPVTPGDLPAGFLSDKGWEYVFYIKRRDPRNTFVVLKKKSDAGLPGALGAGRSSLTSRGRIVPPSTSGGNRPPVRPGTPARPGITRPSDRISFSVGQRQFINPELELNFMIHSADGEQLVYWEPGKPDKKYALKYVVPGEYLGEPTEGLRPAPTETAAAPGAPGATPETKEKKFLKMPKGFESKIEDEYEALLKGGGAGPAFEAMRSASAPADAGAVDASAATPAGEAAPVPGVPRKPTEDERKELKKMGQIIRDARMKPEERAELQKALQGIGK